jgi:hypothetical protein
MNQQIPHGFIPVPNRFDVPFWVKPGPTKEQTRGYHILNGRGVFINPSFVTSSNCKVKYNARRKQRYLQFRKAFGHHNIYVSHAVYAAKSGQPVPEGHQVHHLNGITVDNRPENLVALSKPEHLRYDAIQRALRVCGRLDAMTPDEILAETQKQLRLLKVDPDILDKEPTKYADYNEK